MFKEARRGQRIAWDWSCRGWELPDVCTGNRNPGPSEEQQGLLTAGSRVSANEKLEQQGQTRERAVFCHDFVGGKRESKNQGV